MSNVWHDSFADRLDDDQWDPAYAARAIKTLRAERDEWHRQNGLLRGELAAVTARAEQAEAKAAYWQGRAQSAWTDGDRVANDLVAAVFGDGEVREEFRQKWARIAALGDPEMQHRLIYADGTPHAPTDFDLAHPDWWMPGIRHEVRDVYPGPWRVAEEGGEAT